MEIAIQVKGAFQIEESSHLAPAVDILDVRGRVGHFDHILVLLDLFQRQFEDSEGILHFEATAIIGFRRVDRKEHRVEPARAGAWQVEMPVAVMLANVQSLEKLASHYVN